MNTPFDPHAFVRATIDRAPPAVRAYASRCLFFLATARSSMDGMTLETNASPYDPHMYLGVLIGLPYDETVVPEFVSHGLRRAMDDAANALDIRLWDQGFEPRHVVEARAGEYHTGRHATLPAVISIPPRARPAPVPLHLHQAAL